MVHSCLFAVFTAATVVGQTLPPPRHEEVVFKLEGRSGPAGINEWTPLGPDGASSVYSLACDPSIPGTLYAGTLGAGVFKSVDGGGHWFRVTQASGLYIGIGVKGGRSGVVLAADQQGSGAQKRVIRSVDGGLSWETTTGWSGGSNSGFAPVVFEFDSATPGRVYAAWAGLSSARFFRSDDDGKTWTAAESGLPSGADGNITSFVLIPGDSTRLFVTSKFGVFRSTDGGSTWVPVNTGLPGRTSGRNTYYDAFWITHHPESPARLYALAGLAWQLYKTEDGGDSWQRVSDARSTLTGPFSVNPADGSFWGLASDPAPGELDYWTQRNIVRSTDGGLTWTVVSSGFRDERLLALDADSHTVYSVMNGGVLRTTDNGVTWRQADGGLRALRIDRSQGLAFAPSTGSVLWASFYEGLLRSLDGGASFEKIYAGSHPPMGSAIAIHPSDPSTVLTSAYPAARDSRYTFLDTGLVRSVDGGLTWKRAPNPGRKYQEDSLSEPWGIAYDPKDPFVVYLVAPELGGVLGAGIYKSTDGGVSVLPSAAGFSEGGPWPSFLAAVPTTPTGLFFGNTLSLSGGRVGLWRSLDEAANWTLVSDGIPSGVAPRCLLVHPRTPTTLYACGALTAAGPVPLFRSIDGGLSWTPFGSGLPDAPKCGAIHPGDPMKIYLGTGGGLYRSYDGGQTWRAFNRGLPTGTTVWSIAIDPSEPSHLVLGTQSGLYESLLSLTDGDFDGIESSVEDGAPDGGDGNADTVRDSEQAGVASFQTISGIYATVAVVSEAPPSEGPVLTGVRPLPLPSEAPSGYATPAGAIAFSIRDITPGQCSRVFFHLSPHAAIDAFLIHGATPQRQFPHWYEFGFDGKTGMEILRDTGQPGILLHVCDGLRGDGDLVANGVISILGSPAVSPHPLPAPTEVPGGMRDGLSLFSTRTWGPFPTTVFEGRSTVPSADRLR
ncbi:MAG: hypothetical protein IT186_11205 [Acidobacteria bacterium]|nr:hypothetical protein [Acidobacteriota bacterium]